MGKDCKFKWTDACQDAFKALRALLIKAPVLAFPKEDLPYIVDTDASDYGIGGVLSQCIEGTEHVIAYYSKSLNPAQQQYCTTRRELLAVVATLDHFKGYVWGPKFIVRTDHAALVWLKNLKNIQGMLARWLAKLQQFHFEIIHRPGTQHGNADGLSRCPQCDRGSCAPNIQSEPSDPEQPYASSCIGSSLDSELIPLESGETCMAAVMLAQSDNSKLIITARILSDPAFKLALLDSAGSPLFDPEEPVYATAPTSARKMCLKRNVLNWPSWIALPTRETRGQARV